MAIILLWCNHLIDFSEQTMEVVSNFVGFIPRRDCESSTEGGPIVFIYVLFLGRKRILDFQNPHIPSAFLRP